MELQDPADGGVMLAGRRLSVEWAREALSSYPPTTVICYDLGGDPEGSPAPSDGLGLVDFGRAVLIDAGISGAEAAGLLKAARSAHDRGLWSSVDMEERLEDADPFERGGLYDRASDLYSHLRQVTGVGPTKATKLLHLKRPWLYPIVDSKVRELYDEPAREAAGVNPRAGEEGWSRVFWDPIREDLLTNLEVLGELKAWAAGHELEHLQRVGRLSRLRIQDMLAWKLARETRGDDVS